MANKVPPTPVLARPPIRPDARELPTFGLALVSSLTQALFEHAQRINAVLPRDGTEAMEADLAFDSGFGVNFGDETLTAYDEGTWTPVLATTGTDFDSVTYDAVTEGTYTRIGRIVTVSFLLRTDAITVGSASGSLVITGVPFAPRTSSVAAVWGTSWAGEVPRIVLLSAPAETRFRLYYRSAITGNDTASVVADAGTSTNANQLTGTMTYEIA